MTPRDVTPEPANDRLDELRAMLRVRCQSLLGHRWVTFADVEEAIKIMRAVPPATPSACSGCGEAMQAVSYRCGQCGTFLGPPTAEQEPSQESALPTTAEVRGIITKPEPSSAALEELTAIRALCAEAGMSAESTTLDYIRSAFYRLGKVEREARVSCHSSAALAEPGLLYPCGCKRMYCATHAPAYLRASSPSGAPQ